MREKTPATGGDGLILQSYKKWVPVPVKWPLQPYATALLQLAHHASNPFSMQHISKKKSTPQIGAMPNVISLLHQHFIKMIPRQMSVGNQWVGKPFPKHLPNELKSIKSATFTGHENWNRAFHNILLHHPRLTNAVHSSIRAFTTSYMTLNWIVPVTDSLGGQTSCLRGFTQW